MAGFMVAFMEFTFMVPSGMSMADSQMVADGDECCTFSDGSSCSSGLRELHWIHAVEAF